MTNKICKRRCKRANSAMVAAADMVVKILKLLAIPAGFEPATIGLEGPQPTVDFCGFAGYRLQHQAAFSLNNPGEV